jgi:type II secretion system protein H
MTMTLHGYRDVGRGGFSLIELMVVVVLIGIMAATIIPEMQGTYEDSLLRSTSRELVSLMNLASSRAVSRNELLRVRLDQGTGQYALERQTGVGTRKQSFVPLRDVPGGEGKLDSRIAIEIRQPGEAASPLEAEPGTFEKGRLDSPPGDRRDAIVFYPDGTADAGEIRLEDPSGFRLVLRINPVTARIRIVGLDRR